MEDTPNTVPMILWNRRINALKIKEHNGYEVIDLGEQYYERFLKISEVLIQLVQISEKNFKNGIPWSRWLPPLNTEYTLLDTNGFNVKYNVESRSSCITIHHKRTSTYTRISLVTDRERAFDIMQGESFIGENMIVLQENQSTIHSSAMQKKLHESYLYLKNDKYRAYMIYGQNESEAVDLDLYESLVTHLILAFRSMGYID